MADELFDDDIVQAGGASAGDVDATMRLRLDDDAIDRDLDRLEKEVPRRIRVVAEKASREIARLRTEATQSTVAFARYKRVLEDINDLDPDIFKLDAFQKGLITSKTTLQEYQRLADDIFVTMGRKLPSFDTFSLLSRGALSLAKDVGARTRRELQGLRQELVAEFQREIGPALAEIDDSVRKQIGQSLLHAGREVRAGLESNKTALGQAYNAFLTMVEESERSITAAQLAAAAERKRLLSGRSEDLRRTVRENDKAIEELRADRAAILEHPNIQSAEGLGLLRSTAIRRANFDALRQFEQGDRGLRVKSPTFVDPDDDKAVLKEVEASILRIEQHSARASEELHDVEREMRLLNEIDLDEGLNRKLLRAGELLSDLSTQSRAIGEIGHALRSLERLTTAQAVGGVTPKQAAALRNTLLRGLAQDVNSANVTAVDPTGTARRVQLPRNASEMFLRETLKDMERAAPAISAAALKATQQVADQVGQRVGEGTRRALDAWLGTAAAATGTTTVATDALLDLTQLSRSRTPHVLRTIAEFGGSVVDMHTALLALQSDLPRLGAQLRTRQAEAKRLTDQLVRGPDDPDKRARLEQLIVGSKGKEGQLVIAEREHAGALARIASLEAGLAMLEARSLSELGLSDRRLPRPAGAERRFAEFERKLERFEAINRQMLARVDQANLGSEADRFDEQDLALARGQGALAIDRFLVQRGKAALVGVTRTRPLRNPGDPSSKRLVGGLSEIESLKQEIDLETRQFRQLAVKLRGDNVAAATVIDLFDKQQRLAVSIEAKAERLRQASGAAGTFIPADVQSVLDVRDPNRDPLSLSSDALVRRMALMVGRAGAKPPAPRGANEAGLAAFEAEVRRLVAENHTPRIGGEPIQRVIGTLQGFLQRSVASGRPLEGSALALFDDLNKLTADAGFGFAGLGDILHEIEKLRKRQRDVADAVRLFTLNAEAARDEAGREKWLGRIAAEREGLVRMAEQEQAFIGQARASVRRLQAFGPGNQRMLTALSKTLGVDSTRLLLVEARRRGREQQALLSEALNTAIREQDALLARAPKERGPQFASLRDVRHQESLFRLFQEDPQGHEAARRRIAGGDRTLFLMRPVPVAASQARARDLNQSALQDAIEREREEIRARNSIALQVEAEIERQRESGELRRRARARALQGGLSPAPARQLAIDLVGAREAQAALDNSLNKAFKDVQDEVTDAQKALGRLVEGKRAFLQALGPAIRSGALAPAQARARASSAFDADLEGARERVAQAAAELARVRGLKANPSNLQGMAARIVDGDTKRISQAADILSKDEEFVREVEEDLRRDLQADARRRATTEPQVHRVRFNPLSEEVRRRRPVIEANLRRMQALVNDYVQQQPAVVLRALLNNKVPTSTPDDLRDALKILGGRAIIPASPAGFKVATFAKEFSAEIGKQEDLDFDFDALAAQGAHDLASALEKAGLTEFVQDFMRGYVQFRFEDLQRAGISLARSAFLRRFTEGAFGQFQRSPDQEGIDAFDPRNPASGFFLGDTSQQVRIRSGREPKLQEQLRGQQLAELATRQAEMRAAVEGIIREDAAIQALLLAEGQNLQDWEATLAGVHAKLQAAGLAAGGGGLRDVALAQALQRFEGTDHAARLKRLNDQVFKAIGGRIENVQVVEPEGVARLSAPVEEAVERLEAVAKEETKRAVDAAFLTSARMMDVSAGALRNLLQQAVAEAGADPIGRSIVDASGAQQRKIGSLLRALMVDANPVDMVNAVWDKQVLNAQGQLSSVGEIVRRAKSETGRLTREAAGVEKSLAIAEQADTVVALVREGADAFDNALAFNLGAAVLLGKKVAAFYTDGARLLGRVSDDKLEELGNLVAKKRSDFGTELGRATIQRFERIPGGPVQGGATRHIGPPVTDIKLLGAGIRADDAAVMRAAGVHAGEALGEGMTEGAHIGFEGTREEIRTQMRLLITDMEDVLQIKSPSRVTRHIGEAMAAGLLVGFEGYNLGAELLKDIRVTINHIKQAVNAGLVTDADAAVRTFAGGLIDDLEATLLSKRAELAAAAAALLPTAILQKHVDEIEDAIRQVKVAFSTLKTGPTIPVDDFDRVFGGIDKDGKRFSGSLADLQAAARQRNATERQNTLFDVRGKLAAGFDELAILKERRAALEIEGSALQGLLRDGKLVTKEIAAARDRYKEIEVELRKVTGQHDQLEKHLQRQANLERDLTEKTVGERSRAIEIESARINEGAIAARAQATAFANIEDTLARSTHNMTRFERVLQGAVAAARVLKGDLNPLAAVPGVAALAGRGTVPDLLKTGPLDNARAGLDQFDFRTRKYIEQKAAVEKLQVTLKGLRAEQLHLIDSAGGGRATADQVAAYKGLDRAAERVEARIRKLTNETARFEKQGKGNFLGLIPVLGKLGQAVGNVEQKMAGSGFLGGRGGGSLRSGIVGGVIGSALLQASYALRSGLTNIGDALIGFNARMETATVGLRVFVKGGREAARLSEDILKFATSTPFNVDELLGATKRLLAMGVAANEVLPVFRTLGAAVAAVGGDKDTLNRVILAYGQIRAKNVLISQDLRQLAEAGIPAFAILQRELGLTADQVFDIGRQAINSKEGVDALIRGMNRLYGGALLAQMDTFNGRLANFGDVLTIFVGRIGAPLTDELKKFLEGAANLLQDSGMIRAAETLGDLIGGVARRAREGFFSAQDGILSFARLMPTIVDQVGGELKRLQIFLSEMKFNLDPTQGDIGFDFTRSNEISDQMSKVMSEIFQEAQAKAAKSANFGKQVIDLKVSAEHLQIEIAKGKEAGFKTEIEDMLRAQIAQIPNDIADVPVPIKVSGKIVGFEPGSEEDLINGLQGPALDVLKRFLDDLDQRLAVDAEAGRPAATIAARFREVFLSELAKLGDAPSVAQIQAVIDNLGERLKIPNIFEDAEITKLGQDLAALVGEQSNLESQQRALKALQLEDTRRSRAEQQTIEDKTAAIKKLTDAREKEADAARLQIDAVKDRVDDLNFEKRLFNRAADARIFNQEGTIKGFHAQFDPVLKAFEAAHDRASSALEDLRTQQAAVAASFEVANLHEQRVIADLQDERARKEESYASLIDRATAAEKAHAAVVKSAQLDLRENVRLQQEEIDRIEDKYRAELKVRDAAVRGTSKEIKAAQREQNKRDLDFEQRILAARQRGDQEEVKRLQEEKEQSRLNFENDIAARRALLQVQADEAERIRDEAEEQQRAAKERLEDIQRDGARNADRLEREGELLAANREKVEADRDASILATAAKIKVAQAFLDLLGRTKEDVAALQGQELAAAEGAERAAQRQLDTFKSSYDILFEKQGKALDGIKEEKGQFNQTIDEIIDGLNLQIETMERAEKAAQRKSDAVTKPLENELEILKGQFEVADRLRQQEIDRTTDAVANTQTRIDALNKETEAIEKRMAAEKSIKDAAKRVSTETPPPKLPGTEPLSSTQRVQQFVDRNRLDIELAKAQLDLLNGDMETMVALVEKVVRLADRAGLNLSAAEIVEGLIPPDSFVPQVGVDADVVHFLILAAAGGTREELARFFEDPAFLEKLARAVRGTVGEKGEPTATGSGATLERLNAILGSGVFGGSEVEAIRKALGLDAAGAVVAGAATVLDVTGWDKAARDQIGAAYEQSAAAQEITRAARDLQAVARALAPEAVDAVRPIEERIADRVQAVLPPLNLKVPGVVQAFAPLFGTDVQRSAIFSALSPASLGNPVPHEQQKAIRDALVEALKTQEGRDTLREELLAHPEEWRVLLERIGLNDQLRESLKGLLGGIAGPFGPEMQRLANTISEKVAEGLQAGKSVIANATAEGIVEPVQRSVSGLAVEAKEAGAAVPPAVAAGVEEGSPAMRDVVRAQVDAVTRLLMGMPEAAGAAGAGVVGPEGLGVMAGPGAQAAVSQYSQDVIDTMLLAMGISLGDDQPINKAGELAQRLIGPKGLAYLSTDAGQAAIKAVADQFGSSINTSLEESLFGDTTTGDADRGIGFSNLGIRVGQSFIEGILNSVRESASDIKEATEEAMAQATGDADSGVPVRPSTAIGRDGARGGIFPLGPGFSRVTQEFSGTQRGQHTGIDLAAVQGTEIRAYDDGKVRVAGWSTVGYGNLVVVDHDGYSTWYAHMDHLPHKGKTFPWVSVGQHVTKGQVIGYVGSTGKSTGPHLHFEFREGKNPTSQVPVNPRRVLPAVGGADVGGAEPGAGTSTTKIAAARKVLTDMVSIVEEAGGDMSVVIDAFLSGATELAANKLARFSGFARSQMKVAFEALRASAQLLGAGGIEQIRLVLQELGLLPGGKKGAAASGKSVTQQFMEEMFPNGLPRKIEVGLDVGLDEVAIQKAWDDFFARHPGLRDQFAEEELNRAHPERQAIRNVAAATADRTLVPELIALLTANSGKEEIADFLKVIAGAPDDRTLFELQGQLRATPGDPILQRILDILQALGVSRDRITAADIKALLFEGNGSVRNATALVANAILLQLQSAPPGEIDPFVADFLNALRRVEGTRTIGDVQALLVQAKGPFAERLKVLIAMLDPNTTIDALRKLIFEDPELNRLRQAQELGVGAPGDVVNLSAGARRIALGLREFLKGLGTAGIDEPGITAILRQLKEADPNAKIADIISGLPDLPSDDTSSLGRFVARLRELASASPDATLGDVQAGLFADLSDENTTALDRNTLAVELNTAAIAKAAGINIDELWQQVLASNSRLVEHVERIAGSAEETAKNTEDTAEHTEDATPPTPPIPGTPGTPAVPAVPAVPVPGIPAIPGISPESWTGALSDEEQARLGAANRKLDGLRTLEQDLLRAIDAAEKRGDDKLAEQLRARLKRAQAAIENLVGLVDAFEGRELPDMQAALQEMLERVKETSPAADQFKEAADAAVELGVKDAESEQNLIARAQFGIERYRRALEEARRKGDAASAREAKRRLEAAEAEMDRLEREARAREAAAAAPPAPGTTVGGEPVMPRPGPGGPTPFSVGSSFVANITNNVTETHDPHATAAQIANAQTWQLRSLAGTLPREGRG